MANAIGFFVFRTKKKRQPGAFHKAGFIYREKINLVGACIARPRTTDGRSYSKKGRGFHVLCPF